MDADRTNQPYLARAPRFPLAVPVRYRRSGQRVWVPGMSINMSRTGLLFATERDVIASGVRLHCRVHLRAGPDGGGCVIRCAGRVARSASGRFSGDPGVMALAIDRYELVPDSAATTGSTFAGRRRPRS
jgi:hypothetical protein